MENWDGEILKNKRKQKNGTQISQELLTLKMTRNRIEVNFLTFVLLESEILQDILHFGI